MKIRVRNWKQVLFLSFLITALSVSVPLIVVGLALWNIPWEYKLGALAMAGAIPLFIATPLSIFSMYVFKTINGMLDTLDELVRFDGLTGLITRSHFMQLAEGMRKEGGYVGFVDADHFKRINDTHGHEAGDLALKHLSRVLAEVFGAHGNVARMGGEEFALRLPRMDRARLELLAAMFGTRMRNEGFDYHGETIRLTASLGFANEDGARSLRDILRRADLCLYAAKQDGRDRFVFEESLDQRAPQAA